MHPTPSSQRTRPALVALAASAFVTLPAHATVEAISDMQLVTQEVQGGGLCIKSVPVGAVYGIGGPPEMKAVFTPYRIPIIDTDLSVTSRNINATATTPAMAFNVVSGDFIEFPDFSVRVDVSALAAANGTTLSGRQSTVTAAKLALIGMTKNLARIGGGLFRLRVQFIGLPSQSGLAGTFLYPTTTSPYSGPSALLAAYNRELINVEGRCPSP